MGTGNKTLYKKFTKAKAAFLADLQVSSKSKNTHEKYSYVLKMFDEWLAQRELVETNTEQTEVTPMMITEWKQALAGRGVKTNTIFNYLTVMRSFFRWAIANRLFTEQPILESAFPQQEEIKHDVLTLDEIKKVLSCKIPPYTPRNVAFRDRAIVIILIESGLRVSELINLKKADLDYAQGSVTVKNGKGNKARFAPFPETSRRLVADYLSRRGAGKSEYVFTITDEASGEERQMNRNTVTEMVKGYIERLTGHKGIGAHDLRHAAASFWDEIGAPIRAVQKALGHSNVQTTERVYVDILNKPKAAQEISQLFATYKKVHAVNI